MTAIQDRVAEWKQDSQEELKQLIAALREATRLTEVFGATRLGVQRITAAARRLAGTYEASLVEGAPGYEKDGDTMMALLEVPGDSVDDALEGARQQINAGVGELFTFLQGMQRAVGNVKIPVARGARGPAPKKRNLEG